MQRSLWTNRKTSGIYSFSFPCLLWSTVLDVGDVRSRFLVKWTARKVLVVSTSSPDDILLLTESDPLLKMPCISLYLAKKVSLQLVDSTSNWNQLELLKICRKDQLLDSCALWTLCDLFDMLVILFLTWLNGNDVSSFISIRIFLHPHDVENKVAIAEGEKEY